MAEFGGDELFDAFGETGETKAKVNAAIHTQHSLSLLADCIYVMRILHTYVHTSIGADA